MSLWPIFDSLAPVFLLIALGAALRRSGFLSLTTLIGLNRLTYWIGLPCLTVHDIATGPFQPLAAAGLFTTVLVATVIGGVLAWYCAGACGAGRAARGTFVQAAFRGNLYFISLPVIVYASPGHPEVRSAALIASAPVILLYSIAAVLVLEASRSTPGAGCAGLWRSLATNPQLLACVIGLALAASGAGLPPSLERSLDALGRMALPLALLGIGGSLIGAHIGSRLRPVFGAALIKTALLPLLGFGFGWLLGLAPEQLRSALILLSTPTASASYVLARQLGGDEALASGSIVLSTLLSAPVLALVLALV